MRRFRPVYGLPGGLALLGLAACVSAPVDDLDHFKLANVAVGQAEDARVEDYAAQELHTARDKLSAARELREKARKDNSDHELHQSNWLAEEAQADAEYAMAKAASLRDQAAYREMQRAIETLQQGPQPAGGDGGNNGDSGDMSGNNEGGGT